MSTHCTTVMALALAIAAPAVFSAETAAPADPRPRETREQRDARMAWWREARFGMFIHWGLYAIPAGEWNGKKVGGVGEWIMQTGAIPVADYEKIAARFNPTKFDADAWVRTAKDAGMKYIVITSKHHDGFCLWDSKVSAYDVMDATPFKRDILKELSDACKKQGVRLCFYHSIMDWHHPDAQSINAPGNYNPGQGYKPNPNFPRYVETYMKPQLEELVTKYDPAVMWFDGEWIPEWTEPMAKDLEAWLRKLKPELVVNNRVGKGRQGMQGMSKDASFAGDFGTPEQEIPPTGFPGVDWESCITMNDTWGYRKDDTRWKSGPTMIRMLVETSSKGGNLLMNVGPTDEGLIPQASVERLAEVGRWMKANGEAIYGTTASPFKKLPYGRATQKPGKVYLHIFDWPKDGVLRVPLRNAVKSAYLLADRARTFDVAAGDAGSTLKLPAEAPDPVATVVVLEIDGPAEAVAMVNLVKPAADGSIALLAQDAEIEGTTARVEKKGNNPPNIGYWTKAEDVAVWHAQVDRAGGYSVVVEYSLDRGSAGAEYDIELGGTPLPVKPQVTGSWMDFRTVAVGTVELPAGRTTIKVRPTKKPGQAVLDLRSIALRPIANP